MKIINNRGHSLLLRVFAFSASLREKMEVNALPQIEIQWKIVEKTEAERKMVDSCRELIVLFEHKVKQIMEKVWE